MFCDSVSYGECPEYVEGRWRARCPEDADFAYSESCDDGSAWFRWSIASENSVEVGFDANGTLIHGTKVAYNQPTCTVGAPERTQRDCEVCTICDRTDDDGAGGESGDGQRSDGCVVTSDGFVSQP